MNFKELKKKLLKNPEFKMEYEKRNLAREIARLVVEARIIKGITQEKLAKLIRTKQPSIARLENGQYLPSFTFLDKIAKALKTHINITFDFMQSQKTQQNERAGDIYIIYRVRPYEYKNPLSHDSLDYSLIAESSNELLKSYKVN